MKTLALFACLVLCSVADAIAADMRAVWVKPGCYQIFEGQVYEPNYRNHKTLLRNGWKRFYIIDVIGGVASDG